MSPLTSLRVLYKALTRGTIISSPNRWICYERERVKACLLLGITALHQSWSVFATCWSDTWGGIAIGIPIPIAASRTHNGRPGVLLTLLLAAKGHVWSFVVLFVRPSFLVTDGYLCSLVSRYQWWWTRCHQWRSADCPGARYGQQWLDKSIARRERRRLRANCLHWNVRLKLSP